MPRPGYLPDKPSIAVLPFTNMSGDPEQEYFADGMVEDIITALSRMKWLFVIARNSSFAYKGRAVDVQAGRPRAGRALRARGQRPQGRQPRPHHRAAHRRRDRRHLWAERYDRDLDDSSRFRTRSPRASSAPSSQGSGQPRSNARSANPRKAWTLTICISAPFRTTTLCGRRIMKRLWTFSIGRSSKNQSTKQRSP